MDILAAVREAMDLANRAQRAIEGVTGEIQDGKAAIHADTLDELDKLLEQEKLETKAAAANLASAIAAYRQRHG